MADKNFGDIIQNAIDSQDYNALSDTIQNLVTDAVTDALGDIGDKVNNAADIIAGRVKPVDRRPDYMKNPEHEIAPAQNPWKGNGEFEKYLAGKDLEDRKIYSTGGVSRFQGIMFMVLGITGMACSLFGLLALMITAAITNAGMLPAEIFLLILSAGFGAMTWKGCGILGRLRRFKNYLKTIGKKTSVTIKELSGVIGKSDKYTRKDVCKMIEDNMFLQGRLDLDGKVLFVTEEAYTRYLDEENTKLTQLQNEQKKSMREKKAREAMTPEVRNLLKSGNEYISMLKDSNEAISDEEVTAKLNDLEAMTTQIFGYVQEHPESAQETRKLMKYYLPTTIKLLDSYRKLTEAEESGAHPDQVRNIQKSKKEIEETLDTLNQAFARLFDNLYQDTSVDISADISVLNTLLSQEGLVGDDFKSKEVEKEQGIVLQSN